MQDQQPRTKSAGQAAAELDGVQSPLETELRSLAREWAAQIQAEQQTDTAQEVLEEVVISVSVTEFEAHRSDAEHGRPKAQHHGFSLTLRHAK